MTHIEDVARLRKLLAEKSDHTGGQAGILLRETLKATPWLLTVAGQFQAGDAAALSEIADILDESGFVAKAAYVRRMLAAARIMEGGE